MDEKYFFIKNLPKKTIIDKPIFTSQIPFNIELYDPVITYNDGQIWKIIPLQIFQRYPIIYDKMYISDKLSVNISIISCPFSLYSIIYDGYFKLDGRIYNNNIVIKRDNKAMIQYTGRFLDNNDKISQEK